MSEEDVSVAPVAVGKERVKITSEIDGGAAR